MATRRGKATRKKLVTGPVDVVGRVCSADFETWRVVVCLANGQRLNGRLSSRQMPTLARLLSENPRRKLRIRGRGMYQMPTRRLVRLMQIGSVSQVPAVVKPVAGQKPIWEIATELAASVPDAEWKKLPTDLSKNFKHYLYGAKKQA